MRSFLILLGILFFLNPAYAKQTNMDKQVQCLANAIYFESKSEPLDGKLAVATVVVNRTEHPDYPENTCKVVYQRNTRGCQFSWVCAGLHHQPKNPQQWEECLEIAQKVLLFGERHPTIEKKNGLFFHAKNSKPDWVSAMRRIGKIGNQIFYTERKQLATNERGNSTRYRVAYAGRGSEDRQRNREQAGHDPVPSQRRDGDSEPLRIVGRFTPFDTVLASSGE